MCLFKKEIKKKGVEKCGIVTYKQEQHHGPNIVKYFKLKWAQKCIAAKTFLKKKTCKAQKLSLSANYSHETTIIW